MLGIKAEKCDFFRHCVALRCADTALDLSFWEAQSAHSTRVLLNFSVVLKTAQCCCYGSVSRACAVLFLSFSLFLFSFISVKKKKNTVVTEGSRLSVAGWWKDLWTLTQDAVANSNCSSFQSCTHTRVGVTESNQRDYWRSDGFQSLWMVATLFL